MELDRIMLLMFLRILHTPFMYLRGQHQPYHLPYTQIF